MEVEKAARMALEELEGAMEVTGALPSQAGLVVRVAKEAQAVAVEEVEEVEVSIMAWEEPVERGKEEARVAEVAATPIK